MLKILKVLIGILLIIGGFAGALARKIHLPALTGQIIAGMHFIFTPIDMLFFVTSMMVTYVIVSVCSI